MKHKIRGRKSDYDAWPDLEEAKPVGRQTAEPQKGRLFSSKRGIQQEKEKENEVSCVILAGSLTLYI